jgi:hypothetical protein
MTDLQITCYKRVLVSNQIKSIYNAEENNALLIYVYLHVYLTKLYEYYWSDTLYGNVSLIHNSAINFTVLTLHHPTFDM